MDKNFYRAVETWGIESGCLRRRAKRLQIQKDPHNGGLFATDLTAPNRLLTSPVSGISSIAASAASIDEAVAIEFVMANLALVIRSIL